MRYESLICNKKLSYYLLKVNFYYECTCLLDLKFQNYMKEPKIVLVPYIYAIVQSILFICIKKF